MALAFSVLGVRTKKPPKVPLPDERSHGQKPNGATGTKRPPDKKTPTWFYNRQILRRQVM